MAAAMVLKRKRSIDGFSPDSSMATEVAAPTASIFDVPANLHSRTFKRYRDTRPSDEEVHQRTLGLLYSAQQRPQDQQQQQQGQSLSLQEQEAMARLSVTSSENQQQSLHRFWNINSQPNATSASPAIETTISKPTNCDDCGNSLASNDNDGMDVDGADDTACGACGKHVCFSCSVSNLGEQKRCLQCAGRRVWIGGIGWTNVSVPVC